MIHATHRGFRRYLRSFGDYESLANDPHKRFRYVGPSGAYHFLWHVGEPVPDYEDSRGRRNEFRDGQVTAAGSQRVRS